MNSIEYRRKIYEQLQSKYAGKGLYPQTSKLRYTFELSTNGSHYSKQIALETAIKHATERFLRNQDSFTAHSIRFGVIIENTTKPGHAHIISFPQQTATETQAGVFTNTDAEVLWNGYLQIKSGSELTLEALPLSLFRKENQRNTLSAEINSTDGLVELSEKINLVGQKDQTLILDFPTLATTNIAVTADYKVYAVIEFIGFLVNGGSSTEVKGTAFNS
ncbi:MAG: hypothetical protein LBB41_06615 [Prevotellaceae bacterium]|jgi:hypothetical protein|nr:hypothetical protein [Prevotellaceae bacterium]